MSHAPAPEGAAGAARPLLTSWHVQEARRDARSAPRRQTPGTIPGTKPNSGYGTLGYDSQSALDPGSGTHHIADIVHAPTQLLEEASGERRRR